MKFILTIVASLILIGSVVKAEDNTPTILLTKRNTLVLRDVVEESSVSQLQDKAVQLSTSLAPTEPIFLYMHTPGGDIGAGASLITTLQGLPQKVNTITDFAASMGFHIVESMNNRYILPNGILMSHRARGGASGQIPGELNVRVKFFTDMLDREDTKISKRVGMNLADYKKFIRDEYWVEGEQAVSEKMADKVVRVRCDKELSNGRETETLQTLFGAVELVYSTCPLISSPLEINFGKVNLNDFIESDKVKLIELRKAVLTMAYSSQEFYYDYVVTNKYKQYFQ